VPAAGGDSASPTPPGAPAGAAGVLLVNLGTPDAPTPEAVRRYLAEFLWDPRVVDVFRPLWWLILHGIVLRTRPEKSAALYRKVWTDEGSPLMVHSRRQRAALEEALAGEAGRAVPVALGMRYGTPSLADGLADLKAAGCDRAVVLPLFPQYSISTTLSVEARVAALSAAGGLPAVAISDYHDHPAYIAALAQSVREAWEDGGPGGKLLISFHGTPVRYRDRKGDPYHGQCETTARLLAAALDLPDDKWLMAFQSRFGREPWLQPYTDEALMDWAGSGIGKVDVICPGFPADCLETLEEIATTYKARFLAAGGRNFRYIPALNERPDHVAALAGLVRTRLAG
jgi:protoporphyrin/coproporphyrin ferrochelatase